MSNAEHPTVPQPVVRFDWAKLLARHERTADGFLFSSWDVIIGVVRLVYLASEGRWEYRRRWKEGRGRRSRKRRAFCGARTRKGTPCRARVVSGKGRCRLHGGCSTGPKTAEGRAAIARSNRRRAELRRAGRAGVEVDTP
jgi:hypothetical protein